MKILVRDIPAITKRKDLLNFVTKAMKGPWYKGFASRGDVTYCEILRIKDLEDGHANYHGILDIVPSKLAWEVIGMLNGSEFMGKAVLVRKWHDRTGSGDRRMPLAVGAQHGYERRKSDTDRRRNVEVRNVTGLDVKGLKGFSRTH